MKSTTARLATVIGLRGNINSTSPQALLEVARGLRATFPDQIASATVWHYALPKRRAIGLGSLSLHWQSEFETANLEFWKKDEAGRYTHQTAFQIMMMLEQECQLKALPLRHHGLTVKEGGVTIAEPGHDDFPSSVIMISGNRISTAQGTLEQMMHRLVDEAKPVAQVRCWTSVHAPKHSLSLASLEISWNSLLMQSRHQFWRMNGRGTFIDGEARQIMDIIKSHGLTATPLEKSAIVRSTQEG